MSATRPPLSAVLITLNAEPQLAACLASLSFCTEILVVDSGSHDATAAIARAHGARVVEAEWRGFGAQKNFAVSQASHDWVLCIDADERVSEQLRDEILRALLSPRFGAYRYRRCNRFLGRYLRHGEGYPDWSLRLFDRRQACWSDDAVHERVVAKCATGNLAGDLLHESAETLERYLAKQNLYTTLAAQQAVASGRRAHPAQLILSPLLRFIKFYFLRLGFLDGVAGLVHILVGCGSSFAKYAKMLDLQRRVGE